jgi:hypothetical protein
VQSVDDKGNPIVPGSGILVRDRSVGLAGPVTGPMHDLLGRWMDADAIAPQSPVIRSNRLLLPSGP